MHYTIIGRETPRLAPHYHGAESDDPVFRATIARMFRSNFLEAFSKVHPVVPALIYLPAVGFAVYVSLSRGAGVPPTILSVVLGFVAWTFAEYALHRVVFHVRPTNVVSKFVYFQSHGIHHQYPDDYYRLLMVPPVSIPLAAAFYGVFVLVLPRAIAPAAFGGFAIGYLAYDYVHYAVHHLHPPRSPHLAFVAHWFRETRRRHMIHHFHDHDRCFGVSTGVWDRVFGSHAREMHGDETTAHREEKT